jgi:hypothetical protein
VGTGTAYLMRFMQDAGGAGEAAAHEDDSRVRSRLPELAFDVQPISRI